MPEGVIASTSGVAPAPAEGDGSVISDGSGTVAAGVRIPAAEAAALADGKVTLTEYQQGFAAFKACIESSGGRIRVTAVDPRSGYIRYQTGNDVGSPAGPDNGTPESVCYHTTFGLVETGFTATDPAYLAVEDDEALQDYLENTRPCLLAHGVNAPKDITPRTEQWNQIYQEWQKLYDEGKCSVGN